MDAQKRVQLKTLDKPKDQSSSCIAPSKLAVRFEIKLEESTDDKCPEISYTDLLLKHELKRKRTSSSSDTVLVSKQDYNLHRSFSLVLHIHTLTQMFTTRPTSYNSLSCNTNM